MKKFRSQAPHFHGITPTVYAKLRKHSDPAKIRKITSVAIVAGVAFVGFYFLVGSHAAGPFLSLETENGTPPISPASVVYDSSASGGKAVVFGTPSSGGCPAGQSGTPPNCTTTNNTRPPSGGYFTVKPVGSFSTLPNDAQAAAMIHYSTWEPRQQNNTANHTVPPSSFTTAGYSGMQNYAAVFGRVTGNFTGTTDEIIQWASAKWGLSDEIVRAQAVQESFWYQGNKDTSGNPISNQGYGDFGSCGGSPAPSGYGTNGPASFGIMQDKWCSFKDPGASGYDGWPYSETSTAYNLDLYGAVMRGCYEGWDTWLGGTYTSGDMWGCLGRWFSGGWHNTDANNYISLVQGHLDSKPWLRW